MTRDYPRFVAILRGRWSISDRRLTTLLALAGLSLFVVAMICARVLYTGSPHYGGLVWNLVLAWIPLAAALAVYDGFRRGTRRVWLAVGAAVWLAFFPNAPYIVTDLKHLRSWGGAPLWFDVVLLSAAAWAGLLLGFISLYLMQAVCRRVVGALNAWFAVFGVLAVSSFGIYLGRFRRWNSWDLLVQPHTLLADAWTRVADPVAHPRAVAVTVLFTSFLTATYGVFYAFARLTNVVGTGARD